MAVRARLRNVRMSPRKGRLVADLVRRRPCEEALSILQHCPKGPARPLEKLIRSALANAQERNARHQAGIDLDNLYVGSITVEDGPRLWRIRARAMGRATWYSRPTSHVTVVLEER
jgi:large subunit ribosomal protein L22